MALPILPTLTINAVNPDGAYDASLDYTATVPVSQLLGTNISISTPVVTVATSTVVYYQFPILDAQETITLTLTTPSPDSNIVALLSPSAEYPDMSTNGFQWSLQQTSGQTTAQLVITPSDSYFTAGSTTGSQVITMEGMYQLAVFAQAGGSYQLQLNISDGGNITAPLLATNQIATGVISGQQIVYYRYLTPRGFSGSAADLIFTAYNVSVYISDLISTPGPTAGTQNNVASSGLQNQNNPTGANVITVARGTATDHVGVFYIAIYRQGNAANSVPYSISASFTAHTVLAVNATFVSDDPLLSGQIRYFDFQQPGLTTYNLEMVLGITDATQYGNVYINVVQHATPTSTETLAYPGPLNTNAQAFPPLIGNASLVTGEQINTWSYQCVAQYRCTWQIALYAPVGQNLLNYTLGLTQLAATPRATLLPLNGFVNGTASLTTFGLYYFTVDSYTTVNITCFLNSTRQLQFVISRSTAILTSTQGNGDFNSPGQGFAGSYSLTFSPASGVFGLQAAPNVGSPFQTTYYIRVIATGNPFGGNAVFTLTYTNSSYNGTVPTLVPQPLTTAVAYNQTINNGAVAYYSYTAPTTLTSSQDVIITCMQPVPLTGGQAAFALYYSTSQQFPSNVNMDYNASTAASIVNSFVLSSTDNTQLQPGQTVYISVQATGQGNGARSYIITPYVNQRLALSASGALTTNTQTGPFQAGYAQVIDLNLGYPSPLQASSFVAGLTADLSNNPNATLPPFLIWTSYLTSTARNLLPTLSTVFTSQVITYPQAGSYLSGDYQVRMYDVCTALSSSPGCVYHFMVFIPQPTNSWQLTVSNLITAARQTPPTSTVIQPNGVVQDSVAAGTIRYYNVTVPLYYLTSAIMVITLTPTGAGNPDLVVTAPDYNGRVWPAISSNQPATSYTYYKRSINATSADVITINANDTTFTNNGALPATIVIGVIGTTAASYSLSVTTTGTMPNMTVAGVLSLASSGANTSFSGTVGGGNDPVYQINVGNDVTATTDLFINVWALSPTGQAGGGGGGQQRPVQFVVYNGSYPYIANGASTNYFPAGTFATSVQNNGYSTMVLNMASVFPLAPSTTYYVQVIQGQTHTITASYGQRVPVTLGQIVTGTTLPGRIVTYTLTLPAQKVGSTWSTAGNFLAALSSLNTTVRPAQWLLLTRANVINTTVFSPYTNQGSSSRATANQAEQTITVSDVCSFSSCVWSATVYTIAANASYTFSFAPLNAYQKLTPGFSTAPAYIAADQMAYYTFTLPHPQMEAVVTLQSLLTGSWGVPTANADLFVARTYTRPDLSFNSAVSTLDTVYGTDQVTLDYRTATTGQLANGSYYVAVFGQRPGYYTLSVQAIDPGTTPSFITNNEPDVSNVAVGSSNYYQYNIGQVSAVTDLSLVLTTNASTALPLMYATFSYTHPGPVTYGGQTSLPTALPYEMFSTSSASVTQQLTLNQKLSSSNVLPLQAQSSLFVAVYGGSNSALTSVPYSLSVSVSKRITLTPGVGVQQTLVGAGSVQYYEFSFSSISVTGQQAFVVLTGLESDISILPPLYITNPTISAQVDPIISSSASYTSFLSRSASSNYNALQTIVPADCSVYTSGTCVYKAMVYTASAMPAYAISVTAFNNNDQAMLSSATPALQSVPAAGYRFYYFDITSDITTVTVSLLTGNDDGNADIFVSTSNQHPNAVAASNYQWTTIGMNKSTANNVVVRSTDSGFAVGRWYVSVFGQRASTFQLSLATTSSLARSSTGGAQSGGTSSSSSFNVVALATLLPIIGVLVIVALVLLYLYKTKRSPKADLSHSENYGSNDHDGASNEYDIDGGDLPHLDTSTPSPHSDIATPSPHPTSPGIRGGMPLVKGGDGMEMTPRRREARRLASEQKESGDYSV